MPAPRDLRFPRPGFEPDQLLATPPPHGPLRLCLGRVDDWRRRLLDAIERGGLCRRDPHLTDRAQRSLRSALERWWARADGAAALDPVTRWQRVLQWRLGYLEQIAGPARFGIIPELAPRERASVEALLTPLPAEAPGWSSCWMCLGRFPQERVRPEGHGCLLLWSARDDDPDLPTEPRLR